MILTAMEIYRVRRDENRSKALKFLEFIDAERILCLAMIGDAGDESMALTRYLDSELMATEDLPSNCEVFLKKIVMLFVDGRCVEFGYTHYCLKMLKTPITIMLNTPKTIGSRSGASQHVIDRCLSRMATWVKMSESVLASEFPHFRVFSSFRIFSLSDEKALGDEGHHPTNKACADV